MDDQIIERPKCVKCGKVALCLHGKMWLCGLCLKELYEKIDKIKKEILIYGKDN